MIHSSVQAARTSKKIRIGEYSLNIMFVFNSFFIGKKQNIWNLKFKKK